MLLRVPKYLSFTRYVGVFDRFRKNTNPGRFSEIQSNLGMETFSKIIANAKLHDISLSMPKFQSQSKIDLVKTLQSVGLYAPFDPAKSNFEGITGSKNGLYIDAAVQRAAITIDEKGTEAAAATGVVMAISGIERAEMVIDRPFIYAIRERETNAILSLGRVMNPLQYSI